MQTSFFLADYNSQLDNATIYAGNVSMKPEIVSNKMKVYNVPSMDAKTRNFSIWFDAIIAQFFIVELNQKLLTLCEFKLYEKGTTMNLIQYIFM
jgi:hypothetical protein